MGLEGFEGFDESNAIADYITKRYLGAIANSGVLSAVTNMSMPEGNCLGIGNGGRIDFSVPDNAEYVIGFHWQPTSTGSSGTFVQFYEGTGTTEHGRLVVNADGTFTLSRAGSIPEVSDVVGPFLPGRVYFIEVYYKSADGTSGAWEVRLDGATILGPTGSLDTRNGGTNGLIDMIRVIAGPSHQFRIDNVYWASGSTFLGEGRVVTDLPTSDGNYTAWTASAGSDYQCVDDSPAPNGDTDYISSSTAAQRDSFNMATFGVTGTIRGLIIAIYGRKDDAGARSAQPFLRKSATDYDHTDTWTLATGEGGFDSIWTVDPATGVAFVDSDIDSIECGVENL